MFELELLQIALGTREKLSSTPSDKEWEALYSFAEEHSIIGVMWGGIEKLDQSQAPPMHLLMEWMGQSDYQKSQKRQADSVVAEFSDLMDREHIPYVVFKGLAVASKYPQPALRTIGDVDFYVPPTDFDRAVKVIENELNVKIKKDDIDKHYAFMWKGNRFEMHYQMETFGCRKHQKYFGELIDRSMSQGNASFEVCGKSVDMLQPMEDIMLVFKHWMTHFIGEGIGLRQTTDMAVLVGSYQDEIDVKALKAHLSCIGYLKAFDAMVALVDKYFNIKWVEYGVLKDSDYRNANRLMADVMKNGNFGSSDYKFKQGKKKRLETTFRFFSHCLRYFSLAPSDIICLIPKRISISLRAHGI